MVAISQFPFAKAAEISLMLSGCGCRRRTSRIARRAPVTRRDFSRSRARTSPRLLFASRSPRCAAAGEEMCLAGASVPAFPRALLRPIFAVGPMLCMDFQRLRFTLTAWVVPSGLQAANQRGDANPRQQSQGQLALVVSVKLQFRQQITCRNAQECPAGKR